MYCWDLSGRKTLCLQRRGCRFNPWSVNWKSHMPCSGVRKEKKKNCGVTNTTQKAIKACPRTTIYILGVNIPRWKNTVSVANWPPYREGKEKLRQEADHFRSVDGSFQKQENLWMRLVLVGRKMNRYPQPVAKILKVSTELLAKFSHISSPYGSTLLSQDWIWKQLLLWEPWVEHTFPRQRWGWGPSKCQGPAHRPICDHILSMTSFKTQWNRNQNNHKALSFSWVCFNQRTWGLHNLGREIYNLLSRRKSVEFPAHRLFYDYGSELLSILN